MHNVASPTCMLGGARAVGGTDVSKRVFMCLAEPRTAEATLVAPRRIDHTNLVPLNGRVRHNGYQVRRWVL